MGATTSNPYEDKTKTEPYDQGHADENKPPPKTQTIVPVRYMVGQQADNPFNSAQLQASRYGGQSNPHF